MIVSNLNKTSVTIARTHGSLSLVLSFHLSRWLVHLVYLVHLPDSIGDGQRKLYLSNSLLRVNCMVEVISQASDFFEEFSFDKIFEGVLVRIAFGQEHHSYKLYKG